MGNNNKANVQRQDRETHGLSRGRPNWSSGGQTHKYPSPNAARGCLGVRLATLRGSTASKEQPPAERQDGPDLDF
eukprot:scaffold132122_cov60-Phaeocystis_antarctica.AAC.1